MEIFLIRHLETEFNRKGVLQGTRDIPILEPSVEVCSQIEKNKSALAKYGPFDHILVSEYQRTRMTAECYGFNQEIEVENLLNELNFGVYEGQTKATLISEQGDLWLNNPIDLVLGEPLSKLEKRVDQFITKYKDKDKILLFGHGSWLRAIFSICKTGNINQMNQLSISNNELLHLSFSSLGSQSNGRDICI